MVNNTTYRKLICGLIYLATTRPDLSYAFSIIFLFMQEPRENNWNAAKRDLIYIQGMKYFGLLYKKD